MTGTPVPLCPACGQPVKPLPRFCTCGHEELGHDLASDRSGRRTRCLHWNSQGQCPCRQLVLREKS